MEAKYALLMAGGRQYHGIAGRTVHPAGIAELADIAQQHMGGWPTQAAPEAAALAASREAAIALGATN